MSGGRKELAIMEPKGASGVSRCWMLSMNLTCMNKSEALDAVSDTKVLPDPKAAEAIGRALEAHYADLIKAPLPDKFMELLARLEDGDRGSKPKGRQDALD
jgi:hypothetical protein